jgi:hypothetical protein
VTDCVTINCSWGGSWCRYVLWLACKSVLLCTVVNMWFSGATVCTIVGSWDGSLIDYV